MLLPILKLPNILFVDLQYGDTQKEKDIIEKKHSIKIKTISEIDNFNDIDSLVALVDACDFVISCSNVTAHIAGALGKETYLLLSDSNNKIYCVYDISQPNVVSTTYSTWLSQGNANSSTTIYGGGLHNVDTAFDGFTILSGGATTMTGSVTVYGYRTS
jgi:hypothetical protein